MSAASLADAFLKNRAEQLDEGASVEAYQVGNFVGERGILVALNDLLSLLSQEACHAGQVTADELVESFLAIEYFLILVAL